MGSCSNIPVATEEESNTIHDFNLFTLDLILSADVKNHHQKKNEAFFALDPPQRIKSHLGEIENKLKT